MTYKELLHSLHQMTEEELQQEVQIYPHNPDRDRVQELDAAVAILQVKELDQRTRSCYDNQHHPDDWVLIHDVNLFDEDGCIAHDMMTGEKIYGAKEYIIMKKSSEEN